MSKINIIAEIGTYHEGSIQKAKQLVDAAVESGANTVKFQWVYADEILHPNTGFVQLPTGKIPLYQRFCELECNPDFYYELQEYVHKKGAKFTLMIIPLSFEHSYLINIILKDKDILIQYSFLYVSTFLQM